jgi:hypothetical protein
MLRLLTSSSANTRRVECRHILLSNREGIEAAMIRLENGEGFAGPRLSAL